MLVIAAPFCELYLIFMLHTTGKWAVYAAKIIKIV